MFNYQIRSMLRLCHGHLDIARERLRDTFKFYGYPTKDIDAIIEYHWNTTEAEFNQINVNKYLENTPEHVKKISERIDRWVTANTEPATYWNPFPNIPSYPFHQN